MAGCTEVIDLCGDSSDDERQPACEPQPAAGGSGGHDDEVQFVEKPREQAADVEMDSDEDVIVVGQTGEARCLSLLLGFVNLFRATVVLSRCSWRRIDAISLITGCPP